MCLSWLCETFCKQETPQDDMPLPQNLERLDLSEMLGILSTEFPGVHIFIKDMEYQTTSLTELRRFLDYDKTDENEYGKWFDCDNFSFTLMAGLSNKHWSMLPTGILWTVIQNEPPHALNLFIDNNKEVWLIEPQTDEVFELPEHWKPYLIII